MDIFIAGFPKTGTTALYEHMRNNKSVFIPTVKSPHYFGSDIRPFSSFTEAADYEYIYRKAEKQQKRFDFSTLYSCSTDAVDEILEWNSNAKFIILLRKPWKSIISYYRELKISFFDQRISFEKAWEDNQPSPGSIMGKFTHYQYMVDYNLHLQKFYNLYKQKKCIFLFHDYMVKDPGMFLREISDFCEIETMKEDIPWIHSKYEYRFSGFAKLYRNPPKFLIPLKKQLKKRSLSNLITNTFTFLNEKKYEQDNAISEKFSIDLKNYCINNLKNVTKYINLPDEWLI